MGADLKTWFIIKGTASISRELTERIHIALFIVKQSSVVWTTPFFWHLVHFPVLWLYTQLLTKHKPNSLCPMKRMFSFIFLLLLKLKKFSTISICQISVNAVYFSFPDCWWGISVLAQTLACATSLESSVYIEWSIPSLIKSIRVLSVTDKLPNVLVGINYWLLIVSWLLGLVPCRH